MSKPKESEMTEFDFVAAIKATHAAHEAATGKPIAKAPAVEFTVQGYRAKAAAEREELKAMLAQYSREPATSTEWFIVAAALAAFVFVLMTALNFVGSGFEMPPWRFIFQVEAYAVVGMAVGGAVPWLNRYYHLDELREGTGVGETPLTYLMFWSTSWAFVLPLYLVWGLTYGQLTGELIFPPTRRLEVTPENREKWAKEYHDQMRSYPSPIDQVERDRRGRWLARNPEKAQAGRELPEYED